MTIRGRITACVVALSALLPAPPAWTQPTALPDDLRVLHQRAQEAYRRGDYRWAERANVHGYNLSGDALWLYNASVCRGAMGEHRRAREMAERAARGLARDRSRALPQARAQAWRMRVRAEEVTAASQARAAARGRLSQTRALLDARPQVDTSGWRWAPWVTLGAGALLGIGALAVEWSLVDDRRDFDALRERATQDPEAFDQLAVRREELLRRRNVGIGLAIGSGVLILSGLLWAWWVSDDETPAAQVGLSPTRDGAQTYLMWSF